MKKTLFLLIFLSSCGGGGSEDTFSPDRLSGTYQVELFTNSDNCNLTQGRNSITIHSVQRVSDIAVAYTFESGQSLTGNITTDGFQATGVSSTDSSTALSCIWSYNGNDSYLVNHAITSNDGLCTILINGFAERM